MSNFVKTSDGTLNLGNSYQPLYVSKGKLTTCLLKYSLADPNKGFICMTDLSYYHNGQGNRLTAIGYDGTNPYLIIDGNKHHFSLYD